MALLDPVNALADHAPGFVWRLQSEEGNATSIPVLGDDRLIVNMSVWETIDHLADYVYRSDHVAVMRRRREWFERIKVFMALWWVPEGHRPRPRNASSTCAGEARPRTRSRSASASPRRTGPTLPISTTTC
jgi:Domain of unknown function (DUF3291)